jgi:pimeloyl-ACP methyl ester carboxylesterase
MSQPTIDVSTIVLHGACDGVVPPAESEDAQQHFGAHYERHVIPVAGHFLSREAPDVVVQAICALARQTPSRTGINPRGP